MADLFIFEFGLVLVDQESRDMENFFDKLTEFIEMYRESEKEGLFFEFHGSKITYRIAEEIYYLVICNREHQKEIEEILYEKCDYIRLLRAENERLRGEQRYVCLENLGGTAIRQNNKDSSYAFVVWNIADFYWH